MLRYEEKLKWKIISSADDNILLHFVAFFLVASLLSTGVDNIKMGVDNEKALELKNSTDFNIKISPKNATKHPVLVYFIEQFFSRLTAFLKSVKM